MTNVPADQDGQEVAMAAGLPEHRVQSGHLSILAIEEIPELLERLNCLVRRLEELFPGRKFTPDGHLVGSIGEVVAAFVFDIDLLPASSIAHDAKAPDGRLVQVKLTQGKSVGIRAEPEHLIVLKLNEKGRFSIPYNGPGAPAWDIAGSPQKNGQRSLSLAKLRALTNGGLPTYGLTQLPIVRTWSMLDV